MKTATKNVKKPDTQARMWSAGLYEEGRRGWIFPGFGGQSFMPSVLDSIRFIAAERAQRGANFRLEVDGGIGLGVSNF